MVEDVDRETRSRRRDAARRLGVAEIPALKRRATARVPLTRHGVDHGIYGAHRVLSKATSAGSM